MAIHHTKDKGDLGIAKAHADLVAQGCIVLFPATEHAPFDLVTYRNGDFARIQVKYRAAVCGAIQVQFRSSWADRNGTHSKPIDKGAVDAICIYCPDTDACYYLKPQELGRSVTVRVQPARNKQVAGIRNAEEFRRL